MKKTILGLIFLMQLTSAAQPVANQEILTTQKQSPRKRFTAWVQSQVDATAKDARTLYNYAQRMTRSKQSIKPNEQELQALKNSGMKAGALLAAMGVLYGGHRALRKNELNKRLRDAWSDQQILEIIDAGADINAPINDSGTTILMRVASINRPELVKKLLDKKANVNKRDKWGSTALIEALAYGSGKSYETVRLLIGAGADVNASSNLYGSPLDKAIRNYLNSQNDDNKKMIEDLLAKNASVSENIIRQAYYYKFPKDILEPLVAHAPTSILKETKEHYPFDTPELDEELKRREQQK